MSWRVVSTCPAFTETGREAVQSLRRAGCDLTLASGVPANDREKLVAASKDADAVIAALNVYDEGVFRALPGLKLVSRWGVGFDAVDLEAATRAGVIVTNTPGVLDETVADLAFALMLGIARRIHTSAATMHEGAWSQQWGADVNGKTLGLIGCGRIGTAVARRARGFNMTILAYDLFPRDEARELGVQFVPLDELLTRSDFVSLHAAVTDESRGMIGEQQLAHMKSSAFLINTARGALVDESALVQALNKGQIAGAALDAYCVEPLTQFHPLRHANNVLLTPHIASLTTDNGRRISEVAANAILDLMNGNAPKFVVNRDVLKSPALRAKLKDSQT
ncbi:hydroxyacid dehydrogenase [bacterium]|nr:hydroxyacid dehydrogenase [bacterium]